MSVEQLIVDMKESLEREMRSLDGKIDSLILRFDAQAARLDRQGALIQVGSRWTNRMIEWSEKTDATLDGLTKENGELKRRLEKLEDGTESNI